MLQMLTLFTLYVLYVFMCLDRHVQYTIWWWLFHTLVAQCKHRYFFDTHTDAIHAQRVFLLKL